MEVAIATCHHVATYVQTEHIQTYTKNLNNSIIYIYIYEWNLYLKLGHYILHIVVLEELKPMLMQVH
jgi:hypothetical protein